MVGWARSSVHAKFRAKLHLRVSFHAPEPASHLGHFEVTRRAGGQVSCSGERELVTLARARPRASSQNHKTKE